MRRYEDQLEVARVFGIPWEWFHEIDAACDRFFAKRGMKKLPDFREQINAQWRFGRNRKVESGK